VVDQIPRRRPSATGQHWQHEEGRCEELLREREHFVDQGAAITADVGKIRFDDAAADLANDFTSNKTRSLRTVELRLRTHLTPFFGGRRMSAISTTLVRQFIVLRQRAGASNGEISREVSLLKCAFTLAVQAGKLMTRPYIPLLKENNIRQGFFEPAQFQSVKNHLPVLKKAGGHHPASRRSPGLRSDRATEPSGRYCAVWPLRSVRSPASLGSSR
jgi:hypothetical protein